MLKLAVSHRTRALLVMTVLFTATLVGCAADTASSNAGSGGAGGVVITSNNSTVMPTPTLPPYTVGAWVSNPSPTLHDTITLYAVVRHQSSNLLTPPAAPNPPASVTFSSAILNKTTVQTDSGGFAALSISAEGTPTAPVEIDVTASVGGVTVAAVTFYTILPSGYPSPTPSTTPGH